MNSKLLISNIQRFSIHDGPGIRTTVFLVGCPLHCPWCANPENIYTKSKFFYNSSKCVKDKDHCFIRNDCPIMRNENALLTNTDVTLCFAGALEQTYNAYSTTRLYDEIMKDVSFFNNGGVTFSGGEALLQSENLVPLLKKLKDQNIDICFESCLCVEPYKLKTILDYLDRIYVDIKIADKKRFYAELGGDLDQYLYNLKILLDHNIPVTLRFPVVPDITDDVHNLKLIYNIIHYNKIQSIEIFSVHNLAESKYQRLNMPFHRFKVAESSELEEIAKYFSTVCENVEIIHI